MALKENNNTYPFTFALNSNNKYAKNGIENLFPESLFNGFLKTIKLSLGNEKFEFDETRKRDFEQHILTVASEDDFSNFMPFISKIHSLLAAT